MPEALLFQTGYLTIRRIEQRGGEIYYRLGDAAKYRGRGAAIYLISSSITDFVIRLASLISSNFFVDRYVKNSCSSLPFSVCISPSYRIKSTSCIRNAFEIL